MRSPTSAREDLAFTASEAAELFRGNGIHVSERQLGGLLDRTEGWAAGLRLALLSLDPTDIDGAISRFTGTERLVAEYLIEEVTDQLPAQDRQFLLTTSVADRLSAGLADVLTGRSDSQQTLERLVTHNALLVGLAGRTDWFSVHPLLRDLLRYRLTREQPGMVDRTAPAGLTVVRRPGRTDRGGPARGRGQTVGRGRTVADRTGLAADGHPARPGPGGGAGTRGGPRGRANPPPARCWPRRSATSTDTTSRR